MTGLSKMGHVNLLLAMPLFYMTEKDSPRIQWRSLKLEPAQKRSTYIKYRKAFYMRGSEASHSQLQKQHAMKKRTEDKDVNNNYGSHFK